MKVLIHAPWEVNNAIKETIEQKVEKLSQLFNKIITADAYLKLDEKDIVHSKVFELKLSVPRNTLFVKATAETFPKAIAEAQEKMRHQLIKYKDKLQAY